MGKIIPLTVHSAEIKTAAVEIKTLTVSGKQVTLAVFRQLREEPLISEDGRLNGIPWGIVNYHPDKCAESSPHWHVVWQRQNELLRSRVDKEPNFKGFHCDEGDRFLTAYYVEMKCGELPEELSEVFKEDPRFEKCSARISDDIEHYCARRGIRVLLISLDALKKFRSAFFEHALRRNALTNVIENNYDEDTIRKHTKSCEAYAEQLERARHDIQRHALADQPASDLLDEWDDAIREETSRRQRWIEITATIPSLPHLFIAV